MSGLHKNSPVPTEIKLRQQARVLEVSFDGGETFVMSYEFLRVFTPSAEARGHGPGQETLQTGKRDVDVVRIEPVGNYAVRPVFSDGHDSGLYSWDLLYSLGRRHDELWQEYLDKVAAAGASRDADPAPAAAGGDAGKNACSSDGGSCGGGCGNG